MTPLSLRSLYVLYRRYVPIDSRHYNAWPGDGSQWWPAHEIGHLLTVPLEAIGLSMFGLDEEADPDSLNVFTRVCYELAAMSISRRLLTAIGCVAIVKQELEDTDSNTLSALNNKRTRRRVERILREHHCLRLPTTVESLEKKLAARIAQKRAKDAHARQVSRRKERHARQAQPALAQAASRLAAWPAWDRYREQRL